MAGESQEWVDKIFYFQRNSCWALFTTRDRNIEHQQLYKTPDRPLDLIPKLWEKDYRVKEITYNNGWITLAERLQTPFIEQNVSFEAKWDKALRILAEAVDCGQRIHYLHYAHDQWVIITDKHPQDPKPKQSFHMFDTGGFPHQFLNNECWARNKMVQQLTYGEKMWVLISEDIPPHSEVIQGLVLKNFPVSLVNEFPSEVMMKLQRDGRIIKTIAYDDADRAYGMVYEKTSLPQGIQVSTQFPQDRLHALGVV